MKHIQDIIFIRIRTYRDIFKSALVYLLRTPFLQHPYGDCSYDIPVSKHCSPQ